MRSKSEIMRRLRLGNLRTLLRARCGHNLPDDDAGREYLWELLLPISLVPESDLKMVNTIETWAKWMRVDETRQFIDQVNRTPIYLRKPSARQLGEKLRLLHRERERLKLWTIAPFDMTDKQLKEERKAKKRARDRRRRRDAGSQPREQSLSRLKPWAAAGVSRRTWFRKQAKSGGTNSRKKHECQGGTNSRSIKLLNGGALISATEQAERPEELAMDNRGEGNKQGDNTDSIGSTERKTARGTAS